MSQSAIATIQGPRAVERSAGVTLVPRPTPLTRLHYYDGKFLRASDLELEQRYLRQLVAYSNQAGGAGVVHGYDAVWPGGDRLDLGPGLALDPHGRTLLLLEPAPLSIAELIAASRGSGAVALTPAGPRRIASAVFSDCEPLTADDGETFVDGGALYAITLFHAEALCGTEDVLGRLCAEACATSTERPFILEGVLVRAVPLRLETPLATSAAVALTGRHLRSLVASAYFADEWRRGGSLISAAGLAAGAWCLGAGPQGGAGVPVGVVARAGDATLFFDAWTLRRERIEPPPRRYWAGRMAMRPWDVFLAQVLQFQCQLAHCLDGAEPEDDPCRPAFDLLRQTSEELASWLANAQPENGGDRGDGGGGRLATLERLRGRLSDAAATLTAAPTNRFLIGCGITELPAAGYLPVVPSSALTVNEQVRRSMGEGVDLRFCVVRPDFVAHALEEAQHMERISLLAGLDDPARRPQVDVLVPDGEIDRRGVTAPGQGYEVELGVIPGLLEAFEELVAGETAVGGVRPVGGATPVGGFSPIGRRPVNPADAAETATAAGAAAAAVLRPAAITLPEDSLRFAGAGRGEDLAAGGLAFHLAARERTSFGFVDRPGGGVIVDPVPGFQPAALWLSVSIDRDPFALGLHERAGVNAEAVVTRVVFGPQGNPELRALELDFHGSLGVVDRGSAPGGGPRLTAQAVGNLVVTGRSETDGPITRSIRVSEEVRFERTGDAVTVSFPRFRVFPSSSRLELSILVRRERPAAGRARVEGSAALTVRDGGDAVGPTRASVPLFVVDQLENADVARADHPAHEAAIAALQRLGAALAEPGFADPRARRLFPPPAPAAAELVVFATRDWVLFHRRRNKVCGVEVPPVQVAARRYRLFHVAVNSIDERESLRQVLAAGGGLANFNPRAVGTVEFAGGLASVQTAHPVVRDVWDDALPDGVEIVFGAVASQGAALADGATLAGARLDELAGVLAPVTARAAGAPFEVLDDVPPDLPAAGHDGIVLYATLAPAVTTVCHTVFLLRELVPRNQLEQRMQAIQAAGFSPDLFSTFGVVELGEVDFTAETAMAVGDALAELRARYQDAQPDGVPQGLALAALAVSEQGSTAARHAVHRAQSSAIIAELDGARVVRDVIAGGTAPPPLDCPAVTVLFPARISEFPDGPTPGPLGEEPIPEEEIEPEAVEVEAAEAGSTAKAKAKPKAKARRAPARRKKES